jgi:iron complex transport system substrate-binding protein
MRCLHLLFLLAGIMFSLSAVAACEVTDDAGSHLRLTKPAQRIIVLAPDLVENIFAIGAGQRVVGVVTGSDYPAAALNIPQVGSYSGIDLERIVSMHPDLIITWKYAFPRQLAALRQFGIPVYVAAPKKLDDVPQQLRKLGCLTGEQKQAEKVAKQFTREIDVLRSKASHKQLRVFFQIDPYALITVNHESWINQVLELCGGQNIFANARTVAPEVDRESILASNPDLIMSVSTNDDWKRAWQAWPEMKAVRQHQLFTIDPDSISRAGPRLVNGARQVCAYLELVRTA